jgi:regulator of protease activity HflC (stomatin/prohibitin superfamily)
MVTVAGQLDAWKRLSSSFRKRLIQLAVLVVGLSFFWGSFTAHVAPNQWGVELKKFGFAKGIEPTPYGPGLYFVGPGTTMYTFPRELHLLEASNERQELKERNPDQAGAIDAYFDHRASVLGDATHRAIDAINVQTSDGYAVSADVSLLYSITDPIKIARDFGWSSAYVDSFVINTFRNSVLQTLGKMNAESFYDEVVRIAAVKDAEALLEQRFAERGFKVERLLLRSYRYAPNYEKSLRDKKVAVQLAEKNRKEALVNEERAKLQSIESKGNASITIAEAEVEAQIAKITAEAELYASRARARGDTEYNVAQAESKRLKAAALQGGGGRYVVAMENAKMLDSIDGAAMTPEQYIAFIRNMWSLIGLSGGSK